MMIRNSIEGSARIYQFPMGGRAGLRETETQPARAATERLAPVVMEATAGAWYHEAAINDADRASRR